MPEPAQAEELIPKHLTILCVNEAVTGAAGAASSPSQVARPLWLRGGTHSRGARSPRGVRTLGCRGAAPPPAEGEGRGLPPRNGGRQRWHTQANRSVRATAGEVAASLHAPSGSTQTPIPCSCHGQPWAGLGLRGGWVGAVLLCETRMPPPATLPATKQPRVSKEPLRKHIGGSSKAGASDAVENKSLNIW